MPDKEKPTGINMKYNTKREVAHIIGWIAAFIVSGWLALQMKYGWILLFPIIFGVDWIIGQIFPRKDPHKETQDNSQ